MSYSIVRFADEETISEVPSSWLLDGNTHCWWPFKNSASLIKKQVKPNSNGVSWAKYPIEHVKSGLTYNDARIKAGKGTLSSSEDGDAQTRMKRNILPKDYTFASAYVGVSSDEETLLSKQPQFSGFGKKVSSAKGSVYEGARGNILVEAEEEVDHETIVTFNESNSEAASAKGDDIENIPVIEISTIDSLDLGLEKLFERGDVTDNHEDFAEEVQQGQDEHHDASQMIGNHVNSKGVKLHVPSEKNNNKSDDKILRMFSQILFSIECIERRLEKIESKLECSKNSEIEEPNIIIDFIPFNFDQLKETDSLLKNNTSLASKLRTFLHQVGGNSPKDNTYRILAKLFTNECATKCSWKGIRNNFCISKLEAIRFVKDEITKTYSFVKEIEVEQTIAEWFRFAKQRLEREQKKKDM